MHETSRLNGENKRFFASVCNYFGAGYHGRYFAILLRELAAHEPNSFRVIVDLLAKKAEWAGWTDVSNGLRKGMIDLFKEYEFYRPKAAQRGKYADLAFLIEGQPKVLFEIKEFDGKSNENPAQLKRYIRRAEVSHGETAFVFISRFAPEPAISKLLENARNKALPVVSVRYYEIYRVLSAQRDGPIAKMICDYMEDIKVAGYRDINIKSKNILFLLIQLLSFPHLHGLGRRYASDDAVDGVSEITASLFGNLEALGEWIRAAGENRRLIKTRLTRRFYVQPQFNLKRLGKKLQKLRSESASQELPESESLPDGIANYVVPGGSVSFNAVGPLGAGTYFEFGYYLEVKKSGKQAGNGKCVPSLYASIWGGGIKYNDRAESSKELRTFPSEADAQRELRELIKSSLEQAKKQTTGKANAELKKFCLPAAERIKGVG